MRELMMQLKGDTLCCTAKNGDTYSYKSILLDDFVNFWSRQRARFRTGVLPEELREIICKGDGSLHIVMESPPGRSLFQCLKRENNEFITVTCPPLVHIVTLEHTGNLLRITALRILAAAEHPLRRGTLLYPFIPFGEGGQVALPPGFHEEGWDRIGRLREIQASTAFLLKKIPIDSSILSQDNEISLKMLGDPLGSYEKLFMEQPFTLKSAEERIDSLVMELDALGIIKVSCPGEPAFHVHCREFLRQIHGMNVNRTRLLPSRTRELVLSGDSVYLVIQGLPISRPAVCSGHTFRAIPYPEHIFVFEIIKQKQGYWVNRSYIFALMESSLEESTSLYHFPFSNVHEKHSICFGSFRDFSLASLQGISWVIQSFYTLGYNRDLQNNFRPFKRKDGLLIEGVLALFESLDGNAFPHSILKKAGHYREEMDAIFPGVPLITGYDNAPVAGLSGRLNGEIRTIAREPGINLENGDFDLENDEF